MFHPEAAAAARFYRRRGYNPLPSRTDRKAPAMKAYKHFRDSEPIPESILETWWTPNVQVATGVRWGLAVVDLDGGAAAVRWRGWCREFGNPPATWTVRTGSGGTHLWFALPEGLAACPSIRAWGIWQETRWVKHQCVEVKADRALVVAPPSRHVETGEPYRFLPGLGPREIARPAAIPAWVLDLPEIRPPERLSVFAGATVAPALIPMPRRRGFRSRQVLESMPADEKIRVARSWGLRVLDGPDGDGWHRCRALGREDRNPSASFHPGSGYYCDHSAQPGLRLSLFSVAVELGVYADWRDARDALGERSCV